MTDTDLDTMAYSHPHSHTTNINSNTSYYNDANTNDLAHIHADPVTKYDARDNGNANPHLHTVANAVADAHCHG